MKYLKLNKKSINHSLEEISYCLTLFLLVLFEDITYEEYIYKGLKDKLCLLENIFNNLYNFKLLFTYWDSSFNLMNIL